VDAIPTAARSCPRQRGCRVAGSCSLVAIAIAAMSAGLASTQLRLLREPVAASLSEAGP
jgi:hypothetical protein